MSSGNSNNKNSPTRTKSVATGQTKSPTQAQQNQVKQGQDNKTVFKPSRKPSSAHNSAPENVEQRTVIKTRTQQTSTATVSDSESATKLSVGSAPLGDSSVSDSEQDLQHDYGAALTQIQKSIRNQDSSTGFLKAKEAANKALAEDKIILNKRFVLEETLGAGGMGTVYRARDLRKVEANDLQPNIAVKVLNEEFKNHPDAFVTLQREASRSHTLSHPNIVTVHDFDRDDDIIYMTMELLEGMGLEVMMRQNQPKGLGKKEAFSIIEDVCKALSYAHEKDIVHSDLKPGNIFITTTGAKVLDFGIARVANESSLDDFDAGSLGALTPAYASLEMINYEAPDPRDDIFAAAIIAYELLSGKHPYDRKSADVALEENLRPEKIKELNNKEWKALESALQLERKNRTADIKSFVDALTHKNKIPIFKISSAILFLAVSALVYYNVYVPDSLDKVIQQNYAQAELCYNQQQYECAIENSRAIIKISPDHSAAQVLLKKAERALQNQNINTLATEAEACLANKNILCAQEKLLALKRSSPEAKEINNISQTIEKLKREASIADFFQQAKTCLSNKDYECALEKNKAILAIAPDNTAAKEQQLNIQNIIKQQQDAIDESNRLFIQAEKQANACFKKKDYDCVIRQTQEALKHRANDSAMLALNQNAIFAQKEQQQNLKKADKLLAKAKQCFARKNYSCTIASAESALEFVLQYSPAIKLRNKAEKEVESLKSSFNIE